LPEGAKERAEIESRLKLYREGKPYAQEPAAKQETP